jgi:hypothetical protein
VKQDGCTRQFTEMSKMRRGQFRGQEMHSP